MTFVRTVLGDVELEDLGSTYAHEHLVIDGGRPVELYPDFLLADVDRAVAELGRRVRLGSGPWSTRCPRVPGATSASLPRSAGEVAPHRRADGPPPVPLLRR